MISGKNASRLLGAAFLTVIVTTLIATIPMDLILSGPAEPGIVPGSIPDLLVKISKNSTLMQIGILGGLLNSTGIVALAVLCYAVLKEQDRTLALIALGAWLAEAILFAMIQLGPLALIPLSQDYVNAADPAIYRTLGDFLYSGLYNQGFMVLMWFYCIGGSLWYYLFYRSNYIPRAISAFGLLAVILGLAGIVLQLFGYIPPNIGFLLILPFEIVIGAWLMLRGIKNPMPVTNGNPQTTVNE